MHKTALFDCTINKKRCSVETRGGGGGWGLGAGGID